MKTDENLERLLGAAASHGEQSEPEHEVGDLQEILIAIWSVLDKKTKSKVMSHSQIEAILEEWGD
jgi:hypothetical protein